MTDNDIFDKHEQWITSRIDRLKNTLPPNDLYALGHLREAEIHKQELSALRIEQQKQQTPEALTVGDIKQIREVIRRVMFVSFADDGPWVGGIDRGFDITAEQATALRKLWGSNDE